MEDQGASLAHIRGMKTNQGNGRGREDNEPVERPTRLDDGNAFLPDTVGQMKRITSDDAESFAEEFMATARAGESVHGDATDEVADDEEGGPFIALDDDHKLPGDGDVMAAEDEDPDVGTDPVERSQTIRGARWAARGV